MVTRVLIADSRALSRQLLQQIVNASEQFEAVPPVSDAAAAERICAARQVQLLVMDISMASGPNGLTAAARIKVLNPGIKIILTTALPDPLLLKLAQKSAADGFWYKEVQELPLPELMTLVMAGKRIFPKSPPEAKLGLAVSTDLTTRELEVLHLLANGCADKDVAAALSMSLSTVRFHINNLLTKTGFASRTELAVNAVSTGIAIPGIL